MARGTPDFNRAKDRWVAAQIFQAHLDGESIDVATQEGVFRYYPDGRIVKQTPKRGRRRVWIRRDYDAT